MPRRIRGPQARRRTFLKQWREHRDMTLEEAACLLAAACAQSDAKIYPGLFGQNIVGNEAYVTVSNVWNEMDALPLAEGHCARYQRIARFKHMEPSRAIYDCVSK